MDTDRTEGRTKAWWWLAAVLVLFAPFWTKAFHVDDGAYLHLSTLYGWSPLDAERSDYVYLGVQLEDLLPYESKHPFLVPWVLKVARHTLGEGEVALHAVFTLFALAAFAGVLALARELCPAGRRAPGLWFLLFLPLPVFLVPAHSVMTDVPALAFVVWAAALWARAIERGEGRAAASAGVVFFLAACASFQAVLILPAVLAFAWLRGRADRAFLASVAVPCVAFLGFLGLVYFRHGVFPFLTDDPDTGFSMAEEVRRGLGSEGSAAWVLGSKAVHALAVIGSAFLLLLPLRSALARDGLGFLRRLVAAVVLAGAALHLFLAESGEREGYGLAELAWLALLVALGALAVLGAVRGRGVPERPGQGARTAFLALWALTVLAFNVVVLPFSAARYELLLLPPLFVAVWSGVPWEALHAHRQAVAVAAAATVGLGLAAAWIDARHANAYRSLARDLRGQHPEADLWFVGEWGLRHYLQEEGGRYLLRDADETRVGDVVVIADMHRRFSWPPDGLSQRVEKIGTREAGSALPLRLFAEEARAGFWSHGWGLLPWTVSLAPLETFEIYRVARPLAAAPAGGSPAGPESPSSAESTEEP